MLVGAGVGAAVESSADNDSKLAVMQGGQAVTAACGEQAAMVVKTNKIVGNKKRSFIEYDPCNEDYGTSVMLGTPILLDTSWNHIFPGLRAIGLPLASKNWIIVPGTLCCQVPSKRIPSRSSTILGG